MSTLKSSEILLLGPGPCNPSKRVLDALSRPIIGHMDPEFIAIMDTCEALLRRVFRTKNEVTFPVSGTGTAGMELLLVNFLEPGDRAVIAVGGFFGNRLADFAERMGAETTLVEYEWGSPLDKDRLFEIIAAVKPKLVGIVNGETSTGVYQDMAGIGRAAHENGALLCVDCVTTLATCPVEIDEWEVDLAFSCSQKGLACPPGLAPVTVSERGMAVLERRKATVPSYYFNIRELLKYLRGPSPRAYHHTTPISMVYGLHEGLSEVLEEGLEKRWGRHLETSRYLIEKMRGAGLTPLVEDAFRLSPLTTVEIPSGLEDGPVRAALRNESGIEIGGGLGRLAGKIWRIGLMGENARESSVDRLMAALEKLL